MLSSLQVDFHADDFGISVNSTNDIMELIRLHKLNSISLLPNMSTFSYAVDLLKSYEVDNGNDLLISIHLNFLEGHCCAEKELIPDLVDEQGFFLVGWKDLFIYNFLYFKRKSIVEQLYIEILAQTELCLKTGMINELRFDSHQHTHMIPVVFEALLRVVDYYSQKGIKTTFIRNSKDIISVYLKSNNLMPPVNLVKCLILNFFSRNISKNLKSLSIADMLLFGVGFSGCMCYENVEKVIDNYKNCAKKKNKYLEILFHPGTVLLNEINNEFVKSDFNEFHCSSNRRMEYEALLKI